MKVGVGLMLGWSRVVRRWVFWWGREGNGVGWYNTGCGLGWVVLGGGDDGSRMKVGVGWMRGGCFGGWGGVGNELRGWGWAGCYWVVDPIGGIASHNRSSKLKSLLT